jgi:hypothetical protein
MVRRHIVLAVVATSLITAACGAGGPSPAASAGSTAPALASADTRAMPASASSIAGASSGLRVIGVDLTADPAEITGVCPVKITFNGRITVAGGAGDVSFVWVSSDGDVSPVKTVSFTGPGSMEVTSDWTVGRGTPTGGSGWSSIEIREPVGAPADVRSSRHADFSFSCDDSGYEAIGFGLGGSDADCSITSPGTTFATTDRIRVDADWSPSLQAGTIVTFKLTRDGAMVDGYPVETHLTKSTKCVHGIVSPRDLPVGHYRLDVVPDTSRPITGEFEIK